MSCSMLNSYFRPTNSTTMDDLISQEHQDKLVPIFVYTRSDAISDGEQMLLTGKLAQICRDVGYKYPMYLTRSVVSLIEAGIAVSNCVSWEGIVHDLAWMSLKAKVEWEVDYVKFNCYMITADVPEEGELMEFYVQVGATDIDDPEPCLTMMTPGDR